MVIIKWDFGFGLGPGKAVWKTGDSCIASLACIPFRAALRLVSLFNSISTFVGHLMPKPSLLKNCCGIIYTIAVGIKSVVLYYYPMGTPVLEH